MRTELTTAGFGVDTAGEVMASWNGTERARVVCEPGRVLDPSGLGSLLPKARHPLDRIVEPPGSAEEHRRIVTREWGQLSAVGGLIEHEHDESKARVVSICVEKRSQIPCELCGDGDVPTAIGSKAARYELVVIAQRARVQLHHQAILH